jgi:hypothetical protein
MTVEYTLLPLKYALAFQITSESLAEVNNALDHFKGEFRASNGWTIKKVACPQIDMTSKTIFLRGSSTNRDYEPSVATFDSNVQRDVTIKEIGEAILEFNYAAAWYAGCRTIFEQSERLAFFGWTGTEPVKIDKDGDGNNKLPNRPFFSYN